MLSSQAASTGRVTANSEQSRVWTVQPNRRVIRQSLTVVLPCAAAAGILASLVFHSLFVGIAAALPIVAVVADRLIPQTYTLSRSGATVAIGGFVWLEMPWARVASISCVPGGIKLSAFVNPAIARLENHRGVRLIYREVDAKSIEADIERYRQMDREGPAT